jgi:hypothetical protein
MTARENITRALRQAGMSNWFFDIEERDGKTDRIYATPLFTFRHMADEFRRLGWRKDPGNPSILHDGAVASFREPVAGKPALQVCLLCDGKVEIDLDFFNPWGGDVLSFVGHGIEVAWNWITRTKTNQVRMARALDKRFGNA